MSRSIWRQPAAWLPVGMSVATLAMLLVTFLRGRLVPQPDEGAEAHIFQILMTAQVVIAAWFAARWVPRDPPRALTILAIQVVAALAAMAPVWYLGL